MGLGTPQNLGLAAAASSQVTLIAGANISAGDLVVVFVSGYGQNNTNSVTSVTDGSNSYSKAGGRAVGAFPFFSNGEVWYTFNANAVSSPHITANMTGTGGTGGNNIAALGAMRCSGVGRSANPLDVFASTGIAQDIGGSSGSQAVATGTLAQPVELVFGGFTMTGNGATQDTIVITEGPNFTTLFDGVSAILPTTNNSINPIHGAYYITATSSSVSYNPSWPAMVNGDDLNPLTFAVTFKPQQSGNMSVQILG